jgi:hypothetical protein
METKKYAHKVLMGKPNERDHLEEPVAYVRIQKWMG